jgi:hypothetical protein
MKEKPICDRKLITHGNRFMGNLKVYKFGLRFGRNTEQHVGEAHLHTIAVPLTHIVLQSPKGSFIDREHCLYFARALGMSRSVNFV